MLDSALFLSFVIFGCCLSLWLSRGKYSGNRYCLDGPKKCCFTANRWCRHELRQKNLKYTWSNMSGKFCQNEVLCRSFTLTLFPQKLQTYLMHCVAKVRPLERVVWNENDFMGQTCLAILSLFCMRVKWTWCIAWLRSLSEWVLSEWKFPIISLTFCQLSLTRNMINTN